jgi:acetyl-CoA C-acetyltransferase
MSKRVGIVGIAQTKYEATKPRAHLTDLVLEVTDKLLEQTGISFGEDGINAVVSCSQDHWDGRTISSVAIPDVTGAHLKDESKVAGDGAYAVLYAMMKILSGHHDVVLVVSHCSESQTDGRIIENCAVDHVYQRMLGLDFISYAAMQANRYMHKYGISREQCARVVVKNKGNAKNNPYAQEGPQPSIADVLSSKMLASPITVLDAKPVSDGACAILLAAEDKARRITSKPVWIKGVGCCYDTHSPGERELANCDSLTSASQRAYRMAGITDAPKEIDLAEISEMFSYQELLWMEGLGLCESGEGGRFLDSGATQMEGDIPINPSGGLLSGIPVTVAGMSRVAEAALQLRGECDRRQVPGTKIALAHGTAGVCGQMHCVFVLEKGG